jgi:hypothetical protein
MPYLSVITMPCISLPLKHYNLNDTSLVPTRKHSHLLTADKCANRGSSFIFPLYHENYQISLLHFISTAGFYLLVMSIFCYIVALFYKEVTKTVGTCRDFDQSRYPFTNTNMFCFSLGIPLIMNLPVNDYTVHCWCNLSTIVGEGGVNGCLASYVLNYCVLWQAKWRYFCDIFYIYGLGSIH